MYDIINNDDATKSLAGINFEKHHFLKEGIAVTYKIEKGEIIRNKKIKVFDFDTIANNNFLAVRNYGLEANRNAESVQIL